jgi:hypothetical protein
MHPDGHGARNSGRVRKLLKSRRRARLEVLSINRAVHGS